MKFNGNGIVKWKDRQLVNFETCPDNIYETDDERIIQRLKLCGFEPLPEDKTTEAETIVVPEPVESVSVETTEEKPKLKKGKKK